MQPPHGALRTGCPEVIFGGRGGCEPDLAVLPTRSCLQPDSTGPRFQSIAEPLWSAQCSSNPIPPQLGPFPPHSDLVLPQLQPAFAAPLPRLHLCPALVVSPDSTGRRFHPACHSTNSPSLPPHPPPLHLRPAPPHLSPGLAATPACLAAPLIRIRSSSSLTPASPFLTSPPMLPIQPPLPDRLHPSSHPHHPHENPLPGINRRQGASSFIVGVRAIS